MTYGAMTSLWPTRWSLVASQGESDWLSISFLIMHNFDLLRLVLGTYPCRIVVRGGFQRIHNAESTSEALQV